MKFKSISLIGLVLILSCNSTEKTEEKSDTLMQNPTRHILKYDDALDAIIDSNQEIEILTEGFDWTEGPLWLAAEDKLIFSDIPKNTIFEWSEQGGRKTYLTPSGYTGSIARSGESGSNALLLDPDGNLVLCQHGDRRMARMNAELNEPKPDFVTIADRFDDKRFNSPNDGVYDLSGYLFFTDPPYGLEKQMEDPAKELNFQGVYRVSPSGKVDLLVADLSRPNGIAFSPDYQKVYVANSDPAKAIWMEYEVNASKQFINGQVFYDATDQVGKEKGLPDGLKVNREGILFATGPGGVLIFNPDAKLLGVIKTGEATSNCAFGPDQKLLYITADNFLMRVKLR